MSGRFLSATELLREAHGQEKADIQHDAGVTAGRVYVLVAGEDDDCGRCGRAKLRRLDPEYGPGALVCDYCGWDSRATHPVDAHPYQPGVCGLECDNAPDAEAPLPSRSEGAPSAQSLTTRGDFPAEPGHTRIPAAGADGRAGSHQTDQCPPVEADGAASPGYYRAERQAVIRLAEVWHGIGTGRYPVPGPLEDAIRAAVSLVPVVTCRGCGTTFVQGDARRRFYCGMTHPMTTPHEAMAAAMRSIAVNGPADPDDWTEWFAPPSELATTLLAALEASGWVLRREGEGAEGLVPCDHLHCDKPSDHR